MSKSIGRARNLRRNMTDAEKRLWSVLRNRQLAGCKFRRQHPVGIYSLDFACPERLLAIEVDGGQHAGSTADVSRTAWLGSQGWLVLRFWNNDVLGNTEGVIRQITEALARRAEPSPSRR
jgi:very-short-patch-repair endonuclease